MTTWQQRRRKVGTWTRGRQSASLVASAAGLAAGGQAISARSIDAFFEDFRWDEVERRLDRARKAQAALRT